MRRRKEPRGGARVASRDGARGPPNAPKRSAPARARPGAIAVGLIAMADTTTGAGLLSQAFFVLAGVKTKVREIAVLARKTCAQWIPGDRMRLGAPR